VSGSDTADENLRRLIDMIRDPDPANRDWATLILAQQELYSPGRRLHLRS